MNQHYLFLSSADGTVFHPENDAKNFIVELNQPLQLNNNWTCALLDITLNIRLPNSADLLNVYCDLCDNSVVNLKRLPILRRIAFQNGTQTFQFPYYIPISRDQIQRFRIYIADAHGEQQSIHIQSLSCTLHLKKCRRGSPLSRM